MQEDPFVHLREVLMLGYLRLPIQIGALNIVLGTPSIDILSYSIELPTYIDRASFLISRSIRTLRSKRIEEVDEEYEQLSSLLKYLDRARFLRLYYYSLRLIKKEEDTFKALEPFLYTSESRDLWSKTKAKRYMGEVVFTAPLNQIQTYWVSWNMEEDARMERKQSWDQTMLLASSLNPKGVKTIREKWYRQDEEILEQRKNILNAYLDTKGASSSLKRVTKKESEEERLKREFRMWIEGEQDEHDKIVQSYKNEMMANIQNMQKRQEELRNMNRQRAREEESLKIDKLVGLTDKDLAKMNLDRPTNTVQVTDGAEGLKHVLDKYLFAKEDAGSLGVYEGELMPKTVEKKSSTSLMDEVLRRPKPTMED